MHQTFSESAHFLEPRVVMRLRLRPLTIGHRFLLHDIQSPFVTLRGVIGRTELLLAVLICSQPYPKALQMIRRGDLPWGMAFFVGVIWRRLCRGCDTKTEIEKFWEYLAAQQTFPPCRRPKQGDARTLKAPEEWRLALFLHDTLGLTLDQAFDFPLLCAHALWATRGDWQGWLDLAAANDPVTEARTQEFWAWAAEQDRKFFTPNPGAN